MPHSDDYGIDDDDTLFLAAATQVEGTQHGNSNGDFEPSPRPTKRRRGRRQGPPQVDGASDVELEWSETDDEAHSPPKSSMFPPTNGYGATQAAGTQQEIDDEDLEGYYFPEELGENGNAAKKSRFKIHVPENGGKFPDMIFSQTQHGLDENPAKFRGAIWKRPPVPPPPQAMGGIANPNGIGKAAARAINPGIANYFQAVGRPAPVEDDAAMAARLQEEENSLAQQRAAARQKTGSSGHDVSHQALATQLDDLPSDAFSSSSPEKSPTKGVIELSCQPGVGQYQQKPARLRAPQTGLKQMTIFGQPATQEMSATQAANKRHAWPLMEKDEAPTHHRLIDDEMKTWVYPTNLGTVRDYQFNIVARSLFHNTLVALPTGLGKTFIAATIMLNYYRWTHDSQMIFMAPTKPLIAQQMEACYGIVGIPQRDTVLMTGETTPARRADEWQEKRVFFMTPQTVINDMRTGICDPKKIVLIVVDEAHKATGGYAYTEVVTFMRRFNSSFRVLALTATPGSSTEAVQAVIDNLGIARVELRTEQSIDIQQYTHEKQTETELFDYSDEQERVMELFSKALRPAVEKLNSQNAYWSRDPMKLTAYGLLQARQKWMSSEAGRKAPMPVKGMMNAIFTVLSSLAHPIGLLKFHGISPFYSGLLAFQRSVESGEQKGKTASGIAHCEDFTKMMSTIRTWTNDPDFVGHPKLEYLKEVVLNHFLDAGEGRQGSDVPPSATRVMIFASYRDSTEDICRVLKRNEPMIRPHVFVGQAASKGQEGMDQKKQNQVIQDFKSGKYNTLIATSIGEEGLDIGTVDLIVCYDASSSPIRMLQRIGRTGRKRLGRVSLLLMKEKEAPDYEKAQDNYLHIQKTIADTGSYEYRDDQSPRILPKGVRPIADKRPVEIPIENSQPVDLNEKKRKARGKGKVAKRPPKKFHMPDNVRTGFVKASKIDSDNEEAERPQKKAAKRAKTFQMPATVLPPREPEPVSLPYLADVVLNDEQLDELQQKYAHTADDDEDGVIRAPDPSRFPSKLGQLGRTKFVPHGRAATLVAKTMQAIRNTDKDKLDRWKQALDHRDLNEAGLAKVRLANAPQTSTTATRMSPPNIPEIPARLLEEPQHAESESEPELPTRPARPAPPAAKKPRGRPRKKQAIQRTASYGSAAGEGAESSPDPTPADMRIGTQLRGEEDLGSRDTSGEDEEEEPNSEDKAFLAGSSDPIETFSSSQAGTPAVRGRLKKRLPRRVSLASVEEVDESEQDSVLSFNEENDENEGPAAAIKPRKRRIIEESEEDE